MPTDFNLKVDAPKPITLKIDISNNVLIFGGLLLAGALFWGMGK